MNSCLFFERKVFIVRLVFFILIIVILSENVALTDDDFQKVNEAYNHEMDLLRQELDFIKNQESLVQSWIKTEKDIATLFEDGERGNHTSQWKEFEFPDDSQQAHESEVEVEVDEFFTTPIHVDSPEIILPPRFRILSIKEIVDRSEGEAYTSGRPTIEVLLQNSGGKSTVCVSVRTPDGTIIAKPYSTELKDFIGVTSVSFWLLQHPEKLTIQLETESKTYAIPVFLGTIDVTPTINASPFEASCLVGETASYALTLEGSPSDRRRYNLEVVGLPKEIKSQIIEAIPFSPNLAKKAAKIPVKSVRFSQAFPKHQLRLVVTISKELPVSLIGQHIPFSFNLGEFSETLTITPTGLGRITIDSPQTPLTVSLGAEKSVEIAVTNIGSKGIDALYLLPDRTAMGISIVAPEKISLKIGERKNVSLTIEVKDSARIGRHTIKIQASAHMEIGQHLPDFPIRGQTTIPLIVKEKEFSLSSFAHINLKAYTKPLLQLLGVGIFCFFVGIWFSMRKKYEPEPTEEGV